MNELVNGYFLFYLIDVPCRVSKGGREPPGSRAADFYYLIVIELQRA